MPRIGQHGKVRLERCAVGLPEQLQGGRQFAGDGTLARPAVNEQDLVRVVMAAR